MQQYLYTIAAIFVQGSPAIDCIIVGIVAIIARYYHEQYKHRKLLESYRDRQEDIWIAGLHPKGGRWLDIPNEFVRDLLVFVPHNDVIARVESEKALLAASGNVRFNDPALTEDQRIQVNYFLFQDYYCVNESWEEDYPARIIEQVQQRRAKMHKAIGEMDITFYNMMLNEQKGVEWNGVQYHPIRRKDRKD